MQDLELAYILHQRKYRETSLLIDFLTQHHGVVRVIAKGACHAKSPWRGILQGFNPLLIRWSAKHELGTLTHAEASQFMPRLQGHYLLSGFYLNELIIRLIHPHAPVPDLFRAYQIVHQQLVQASQQQKLAVDWYGHLRIFEKHLLAVLGITIDFTHDCCTGELIKAIQYYRFIPEKGFIYCANSLSQSRQHALFQGESLLALANERIATLQALHDAKRLMRLILRPLLGKRPLHSRLLF